MVGKRERSATRRTQEMRSAETRARILDATLECLIELGYAATSTPEVCRRAGMSRGALLHHFPTKAELVISAVTHLAARRANEIRDAPPALPPRADALDAVFARMWLAFSGPLFHAALELWVAARCDAELHAALYPVERRLGAGIRDLWRDLESELGAARKAKPERFDDLITLSIHLLRGMAMQRILRPDEAERERLFQVWKMMARRELGV